MMLLTRFPNRSHGLRGANIATQFCQVCEKEKTHGYYMQVSNQQLESYPSMFVCDDCLAKAKAAAK